MESEAALPNVDMVARPDDFDEAMYLRLNQDVAAAVDNGVYASGLEHYQMYGAKERRQYRPPSNEPQPVVVARDRPRGSGRLDVEMPAYGIEALRVSPSGGVFIVGWIDDKADALTELRLEGEGWSLDVAAMVRVRRRDVEAALATGQRYLFGFWSFVDIGRPLPHRPACRVRLRTQGGAGVTLEMPVTRTEDCALRDAILGHLADGDFFGNVHGCAVVSLDGGVGEQIVAYNRRLITQLVANPHVERFGPARAAAEGVAGGMPVRAAGISVAAERAVR